MLKVEVAYVSQDKQFLEQITIAVDSTVQEAIQQSHVLQEFPELRISNNNIGIFSIPTTLNNKLKDGDRVEIYRELTQNPMDLRRARAKKK